MFSIKSEKKTRKNSENSEKLGKDLMSEDLRIQMELLACIWRVYMACFRVFLSVLVRFRAFSSVFERFEHFRAFSSIFEFDCLDT